MQNVTLCDGMSGEECSRIWRWIAQERKGSNAVESSVLIIVWLATQVVYI